MVGTVSACIFAPWFLAFLLPQLAFVAAGLGSLAFFQRHPSTAHVQDRLGDGQNVGTIFSGSAGLLCLAVSGSVENIVVRFTIIH